MTDLLRAFTALAILGFAATAPVSAQAQTRPASACPAGYEALAENDPERAVAAFESCLSRQLFEWRVEAELRTRLGAAHLALGEGEAALLAYNQVFALIEGAGANSDNPLIRRNRAAAYLQTGDYEAALDDLDLALAARPDDAFARVLQGSALLDLDRDEEAVAAFDAAVRAEPEYTSAWIGRSAAFVEMGLTENAVEDAQEALALAPTDAGALNALCWSLVQDGRAADAMATCDAAVEADPESGAIVHSRAAALEQVGRTSEAAELYARAHALAPDDPEITADHERVNGG